MRAGGFTFIDLFARIGGLRRSFDAKGGRCVFTSEVNHFAQQTYKANYKDDHELSGDVARTLSARYYKDGSEILISRGSGKNPRRLTPRECARLMGFDGPGRAEFKIPVSDTQSYRQFGNAVVVPVVEAVANYMCPFIFGEEGRREKMARDEKSVIFADKSIKEGNVEVDTIDRMESLGQAFGNKRLTYRFLIR